MVIIIITNSNGHNNNNNDNDNNKLSAPQATPRATTATQTSSWSYASLLSKHFSSAANISAFEKLLEHFRSIFKHGK